MKLVDRLWMRRLAHEVLLHRTRMASPPRRPSVVVFPSSQPWDAASNLGAWLRAAPPRARPLRARAPGLARRGGPRAAVAGAAPAHPRTRAARRDPAAADPPPAE